MFSKIIEAIKNLFGSLFGGSKKPKSRKQIEKEAIIDAPQDAAEVTQDSIVIVADETDHVVVDEPHEEFDPELFDAEVDVPEIIEEVIPVVEEIVTEEEPAVVIETAEETVETEEEVEEEETTPSHTPRYLWCLDNGHGSGTPGKRSPVFDDGETQLLEYKFNRIIVAKIIKQLDETGVKYYNVVPEAEIDNFLKGRVKRANAKKSDLPKIYLSIHANAAPAPSSSSWAADSVSGIETWHYHKSKKGKKLAGIFQKELIAATGFKNRHVKSKSSKEFYVLRKTAMVSVLTENGFYNNKKEAAALMTDNMQQKIADAHVAAIMEIELNGIS